MDLPTVKASVKAWEKAFKAQHKRDPTKDDIKRDSGGIADEYALYRRLTKSASSSQSQSQSRTTRTSSSQVASSSTSQRSRATPRVTAPSQFPTTPTPPTRRQSSGRYSEYHEEDNEDREEISLQAGPSISSSSQPARSLKRTASKAALQPPTSPAHRLLTTPKKRPYTGPIHDPNPINPFAASPLRRSAIKNNDTTTQPQSQGASPFFHATSPMKLKELLQENSLRKVQERNGSSPAKEITPRTKARKRLTGEIEETPAKSRVRRKRGAGPGGDSSTLAPGLNGLSTAPTLGDSSVTADDEEEDEFGPTPVKPTRKQESFHSFFEMDNGTSAGPSRNIPSLSRNGSSDMVGRLLAAGGNSVGKGKGKDKASPEMISETKANGHVNGDTAPTSPDRLLRLEEVDDLGEEVLDATSWEEEPVPGPSTLKPQSRPDKTVSISDDELDEWDPEASHVRHRVRIVPTRSRPKKHWSDSDNESIADEDLENAAGSDEDEELPSLDDATTSQTNPSVQSPPQLLSLLSLTSPNQRQGRYAKLKELRYKALFNPSGSDARKLKAFTKGQEAFVAGEIEEGEDEEDAVNLEEEEQGVRADDDWESESDGWNRTGVEMDDDAW